jgi:hypothetical protein
MSTHIQPMFCVPTALGSRDLARVTEHHDRRVTVEGDSQLLAQTQIDQITPPMSRPRSVVLKCGIAVGGDDF